MAGADGTIVIDIDIPVNKVRTDSQDINSILSAIGDHAGDKLDSHFKENTEKVKRDAESTSREVNSKLDKEVKTKYSIDDSEADGKIDKIHARIRQIPKDQQTDFTVKDHSSGALHEIKNRLLGIRQESEKAKHTFRDMFLGSTLGGLTSNLISLAWGHITGGIHSAIDAAKQYALEQQTMNATWLTLTNSATKGKAMVKQINDMAIAAQNSTEMVDQLSQKFYAINNNAKQTGELTKSILTLQDAFGQTDAAVENFGTQFSQMMANGKVSAQDMMSIVNTFPKLRPMLLDYERRIHHSSNMTMQEMNKLMSDGKIKSQDMINVVLEAGKKFNKATGNFTATIPGMVRVVHSQMPVLLSAFTTPWTKLENPILKQVTKWITSAKTKKAFTTLGTTMASGVNKVVDALFNQPKKKKYDAKKVSTLSGKLPGNNLANLSETKKVNTGALSGKLPGNDVNKALKSQYTAANLLNDVLKKLNKNISAFFDYVADHAQDFKDITKDLFSITSEIGKTVWHDFASIAIHIGQAFGLIGKNAEKNGGAVHALAQGLNNIAKHRNAIRDITHAIVAMAVINKVGGRLFSFGEHLSYFAKGLKGIKDIEGIDKVGKKFLTTGRAVKKTADAIKNIPTEFKLFKDGIKGVKLAENATKWQKVFHGLGTAIGATGRGIATAARELGGKFVQQLKLVGKGVKGLGKGIWSATKWVAGQFKSAGKFLGEQLVKGYRASISGIKGFFGKGTGAGKLTGLLQSAHSAGGFKNLSIAGKIGTGLAGAGVVADAGYNAIFKAFKDRHNATKRSQDIGKGIGAGIGGGIGLYFGGPLGAALGAKIGGFIGKWGGEGVNQFTKGWQRQGKNQKPQNWVQWLGFEAHDSFNFFMNFGKKAIQTVGKGFSIAGKFLKKNGKEIGLYLVNPIAGAINSLYKHNPKFREWVNGIGKTLKKGFNQAKNHVHNSIKSILCFIIDLRKEGKTKLHQFTSWIGKNWNGLKKNSSEIWDKIKDSVIKNAEKAKKSGSKNFSKLQSVMGDIGKDIKKQWHSLWNGLADFFEGIWKSIKKTASGGINGVVGVINGGISGIDNVIHSFGGKEHAIGLIPKVKLATGTLGNLTPSITQPTLALLNDGHDSPETGNKETIWDTKTGALGVVNGTNVPFLLQPGMEVFSASQSRDLGFTHFAKGTNPLAGLESFVGGLGSWISQKGKQLKKWFDLATKIVTHPLNALDNLMKPSSKDLNGIFVQLGKGMFDKSKDAAKEWWSALWNMASSKLNGDGGPATGLLKAVEKYGEGHKYVWGAAGPTTFDCSGLVMYALKHAYGIDFPHFSGSQYGMTQHINRDQAKMGDLVFWGNHGDEHVGVYAGGNKYFSAESPSQGIHMNTLDSVVGKGKPLFGRVRGLSQSSSKKDAVKATSGLQKLIKDQVGNGFFKFLSKLGDLFGITGEAGMPTGDHTHWMKQAHIPRSDWAGINDIVSAESSWNPRARNGRYFGLGQTAKLAYYKRHGGVTNPIAQLMGIMDYIHDRYGSVANAVRFRKAHNWYGNGGITSGPELAVVGEDGIERIINVMKPSADALIDNTIKARAQVAPESPSGKLAKLIDFNSVKYSQANGYGMPQDSRTRTVINQVGSNQSNSVDGDVYIDVHADSAKLARVIYPKVKILQGKDLDIAGAGGAIS